MKYQGEEIKTVEIPIDKERRKHMEDDKIIKLLEDFFEDKYTVAITESLDEKIPLLRITKKN